MRIAPAEQPPAAEAAVGPDHDLHLRPCLAQAAAPAASASPGCVWLRRSCWAAGRPSAGDRRRRRRAAGSSIGRSSRGRIGSPGGRGRSSVASKSRIRSSGGSAWAAGTSTTPRPSGAGPCVDAVLQAAERRGRGEWRPSSGTSPGGQLQGGVVAEGLMVVEVFVAQGDGEDPLGEHRPLVVDDEEGLRGSGMTGRGRRRGRAAHRLHAAGAPASVVKPAALEIGDDCLGPEAGKEGNWDYSLS